MKKIKDFFKNPKYYLLLIYGRLIPKTIFWDKRYIEKMYKLKMKKELNLNNPQTYNEKLQWLKLYDRKDIYTTMVDKYEVKNYVASIVGEEYIIPTLGVWDKFDDIDFEKLPNQFVIKCTHDSGGLVIVKDKSKLNIKLAKKKINKCLKRNYYYSGREWPYKNVKPRILVEKYMEDQETKELRDYKFFCFDGEAKCFKIDFNRATSHQANYYDINGNLLNCGEVICPPDYSKLLKLPKNLNIMVNFAQILSKGVPFVRVDFYEHNDKVYFGELTFYPASGLGKFEPIEWDKKFGDWLVLPDKIR